MKVVKMRAAVEQRAVALCHEREQIASQIKALDEAKRAIDQRLLELTDNAGGELRAGHYRAVVVRQHSTTTDYDVFVRELVAAGVRPVLVEKARTKATVVKPKTPFVKVSVVKEEQP